MGLRSQRDMLHETSRMDIYTSSCEMDLYISLDRCLPWLIQWMYLILDTGTWKVHVYERYDTANRIKPQEVSFKRSFVGRTVGKNQACCTRKPYARSDGSSEVGGNRKKG